MHITEELINKANIELDRESLAEFKLHYFRQNGGDLTGARDMWLDNAVLLEVELPDHIQFVAQFQKDVRFTWMDKISGFGMITFRAFFSKILFTNLFFIASCRRNAGPFYGNESHVICGDVLLDRSFYL